MMMLLLLLVLLLALDLGAGIISNIEAAACNAARDIVIQQTDLQFSHPMTTVSVSVANSCPCHVTDIVASCGSAWDQSMVDAKYISVNDRLHTCQLLIGQELSAFSAPVSFVYQHSPPLTDLVPISASFSDCAASAASSQPARAAPPVNINYFSFYLLMVYLALAGFELGRMP